MQTIKNCRLAAIASVAVILFSCQKTTETEPALPTESTEELVSRPGIDETASYERTTIRVFATGLNNPRGLKFGPDRQLYVAEAGIGGTNSTVGQCEQVGPPVGPYTGSPDGGRISRIDKNGIRYTVSDQLPSATDNILAGGNIMGVADVAFIGNTLYGLLAGGGCSHGNPGIPNAVVRFRENGSWEIVADLSQYFRNNPVQNPAADFEHDGSPYSMIRVGLSLYVMEANRGEIIRVTPWGRVTRITDVSATQGHIVPTALGFRGQFIFGNLNTFPIVEGSSSLYKLTYRGDIQRIATGFTTILGITFDYWGRIYVLQNTTGNPFPTPGTGSIIRINHFGRRETIATGLNLPTAMTFGPDGKLYVSNVGMGPAGIGGGEILQISVRRSHHDED